MCKKSLLLVLLMALFAPWAANAQNSIPFNEGFESMTSVDDVTAAGWTLSTTESGTFLAIETGASNVYEGSKSLNLDAWDASSSSSVQYLGLPLVAGDLNTLQISFAYKVTSGTINVGYLTDATDFSTFTSLAQYSSSSSFTVKTTDLSEAPRDAARLVLKYTGWYRCYLDSFEVKALPSCQAATSITASDITATSATIAWEGEGNTWNLKYNGIEVNGISAMSYNLTGLTDGTNYTVSVQNVCSDGTTTDWISTTFRTPEICPDGKICIGEGTTTSTYLPTYNFYNYSLTEQIYTAEEIGQAGAILSVDIYSVGTVTRTLEFYMVSTEKETFTDGTDWIAATASDLVYNGSVTFAANSWNTIEFDNPFIYDGRSNVALIVRDMTGSYVSGINFYVFDAPSQAIRIYRDASAYDLANPGEGTVMDVKNRVRLVVGEPPACPKPTGLTVNYTGGTEATINWTSDATAWNMRVNGTPINGTITNPYTLTGLELATTYEVEVQANCGDATSEWAGPVSFKTDNCMPEDQCALTFVVTDSFGDSWNEASIQIYDYTGEELGDLLATVTNENLDGESGGVEETQTITLNFCNGQELAIFWVEGNYDDECSYTITDINGDVVAQNDMELAIAYTMNCTETDCRKPTDFVASEIGGHSVVLSWTENGPATEWVIAYLSENDEEITEITVNTNPYTLTGLDPETMYAAQVTPVCEVDKPSDVIYWTTDVACPRPTNLSVTAYPTSADMTWNGYADAYDLEWALLPASESKDALWLQYDDGTVVTNVGNSTIYEWTWAVMYPADMLQGNNMLSKVAFYETSYYSEGDPITINIYSGGDSEPGTLVYTENVTCTGTVGIHEVILSSFVNIDPAQNLWITLTSTTIDRPMAMSAVDEANGRWVDNGSWMDIGTALASVSTYTFMIRGYVEPGFDPSTLEWNPVSGVTSPYTLEGLRPETTYVVRVKSVCGGDDGESDWTMTTFTTPSACDMPINLAANDITYNSAKLSWTGYQESYNVKYRSLAHIEDATFSENFDEGMADWTTIDADGDGYTWVSSMNPGDYHNSGVDLTGNGHNGSAQFVISGSYSNSLGMALTPDNYLVSPQIELGGGMEFWVSGQDAGYFAEHFGVAVSTSGNTDAADFTTIAEWTLEDGQVWHKYVVDLSAYTGQGYVAIRHFDCTDQFILNLDDITFGTYVPTSAWTTVTVNEPTYTLTGLTAQTEYEWQVQGVNANCGELDWTEIQSFTTTEKTTETQTIALSSTTVNYCSFYVDITLADLQTALTDALGTGNNVSIMIKSKEQNCKLTRGRWIGQLSTLDLGKMYKITVNSDCEITLEGMPVNPAEHSVNISGQGVATWIAFPFNTSMTVTDAFAGFAVNNDVVKSKAQNASYTRGRWNGALQTLEPGQGYIYKSAATGNRTFTFPTSAK